MMKSSATTTQTGWVWWSWVWWSWVWSCLSSLWATCLPYLALAWMLVRTTIPIGEKEDDLVKWVKDKVPSRRVSVLGRDLADGVTLCGLLEALVPGTCPRHDLLPPDQPEANLRIASRLANDFLGVTQDISGAGSGALYYFVRRVRYAALKRKVLGGPPVTQEAVAQTLGSHQVRQEAPSLSTVIAQRMGIDCWRRRRQPRGSRRTSMSDILHSSQTATTTITTNPLQVIARGMGLQMGVVGRKARFTLYLSSTSGLDLVVEVKNVMGDYCSHRITNGSPSRNRNLPKDTLMARHNIPLEYELRDCEVRVAWVPLQQARHSLVIIWRGQHVVGSPYTVLVDQSQHNSPVHTCKILGPLMDSDTEPEGGGGGTSVNPSRRSSLNNKDTVVKPTVMSYRAQAGALRFMSILRRRVVRRVVHVGDEDVVLQGNESIGRSSKAREAFQKIRTKSSESLEDILAYRTFRHCFSAPSSRRSSQQVDGDPDSEWVLQGRVSPRTSKWVEENLHQGPDEWPGGTHLPEGTPSRQSPRVTGAPTNL